MKSSCAGLALAGCLLALGAQAADPARAAGPARAAACAPLEPLFQKFMAENHVPGLVFGVVADGTLACVRGLGVQDTQTRAPVTADTVFRIASMSKQFAALAVLRLRDAGRIALDAPAERYIPQLARWRYPTSDSPKITVRDLLSHAGGFVTDDPWGDRQLAMSEAEFSRFIAVAPPFARAPQATFEYSNFGFALVGRLITNVAGMPYSRYVETRLLHPLGMAASGYDIAQVPAARLALGYRWEQDAWAAEPMLGPGAFGAMGGVLTSASDYARYVAWVLSAWPPRDGAEDALVRRASVRELARPAGTIVSQPADEPGGCARAVSYGFGMRTYNDCVLGFHFGHSGGLPGFGSNVLMIPDRNLGVFAFANRTYAPAARAVREAANALVRSQAFPARTIAVSPALAQMVAAAQRIYAAGGVDAEHAVLAGNFLLDRAAPLRAADIAALHGTLGACTGTPAVTADHALGGTATWTCERGSLQAVLLLAPVAGAALQKLEFSERHD